MSAYKDNSGIVSLENLTPDKVGALIRAIEGANLPDKRLLQEELKSLENPVQKFFGIENHFSAGDNYMTDVLNERKEIKW